MTVSVISLITETHWVNYHLSFNLMLPEGELIDAKHINEVMSFTFQNNGIITKIQIPLTNINYIWIREKKQCSQNLPEGMSATDSL